MKPLTEEEQKDVELRSVEFNKRYKEMSDELQIDFISYPEYIPTPQGFFITRITSQVTDLKYRSVPSPLSGDIIKK